MKIGKCFQQPSSCYQTELKKKIGRGTLLPPTSEPKRLSQNYFLNLMYMAKESEHDFVVPLDTQTETGAKSRSWVFTLNNYTPENVEALKALECTYIVFGFETAPSTGTPHLQGYIYFNNQVRMKTVRKAITGVPWVRIANGSAKHNRVYCTKSGDFHEHGTMPEQGKRTDVIMARDIVTSGGTVADVIRKDITCNHQTIKVAETVMKYLEPKRTTKPSVTWVYGKSGLGKTYAAETYLKQFTDDVHIQTDPKWWDGYDRHNCVIIDDFRDTNWPYVSILRLLDRYPNRIEFKGGTRQFVADHIIVTSPHHPSTYYEFSGEDNYQILRRIDRILEMRSYAENIFST